MEYLPDFIIGLVLPHEIWWDPAQQHACDNRLSALPAMPCTQDIQHAQVSAGGGGGWTPNADWSERFVRLVVALGVAPEATLARIKTFDLSLEGIFSLLPDNCPRTDDGVTDAMSSCLAEYNSAQELLHVCVDSSLFTSNAARRRAQAGSDRGGGDNFAEWMLAGWPAVVADMVANLKSAGLCNETC